MFQPAAHIKLTKNAEVRGISILTLGMSKVIKHLPKPQSSNNQKAGFQPKNERSI
jgi:hypothetical protein